MPTWYIFIIIHQFFASLLKPSGSGISRFNITHVHEYLGKIDMKGGPNKKTICTEFVVV